MKTAILADLHLTDDFNTVKSSVLKWALDTAQQLHVDLLCCIGDLTAQGSDRQTREVLRQLNSCKIPYCSTPGNAEVRIFRDGRNANLFDVPATDDVPVILINTLADEPVAEDLLKLEALPDNSGFLLATHSPQHNWSPSAQAVLQNALRRGAVTAVIAGHSHHDADGILRGLDPDKAAGGPPMLAVLEQMPDRSWLRTDVVMPGIDPADWTAAELADFRSNIGFSTMWDLLPALEFAALYKVANVELRPPVEYNTETLEAVKKWRECGGKTLSLHLPDLKPVDPENKLLEHALLAHKLGCDRVTLHVPRVTASEFANQKERLLEQFGASLQVLLANDITIGIENLHTCAGKNTFETRNFGCTIDECREWILLLRERFNTDKIGFHLDIGHARNNAPLSGKENLSDWYCRMGDLINGWHLHQVEHKDGEFFNHQPLTGFYGKLISLGGMFMALRAGQLPGSTPMFLEARTWEGNVKAYTALMRILGDVKQK
ncbi:MAG: hypothetical protein E7047_01450 [Lentisphaerae bacterium]|nr:hypothetical protein [Lentisphaerota bacterium]